LVIKRLRTFISSSSFIEENVEQRYQWLSGEGIFIVRIYQKLEVEKTLTFRDKEEIKKVPVTCGYLEDGDESWELLLTTGEVDHFE
jgi:hypothetical protein